MANLNYWSLKIDQFVMYFCNIFLQCIFVMYFVIWFNKFRYRQMIYIEYRVIFKKLRFKNNNTIQFQITEHLMLNTIEQSFKQFLTLIYFSKFKVQNLRLFQKQAISQFIEISTNYYITGCTINCSSNSLFYIPLIILLMLYITPLILLIQIVLSENDNFNYNTHGHDWTQGGCSNGTKQSPIILTTNVTPSSSFLFGAYKETQASLTIYKTTTYIKGSFGQAFTMTINGNSTAFKAGQIRIRCQSEHVIQRDQDTNFTRFPLQLQIFHTLIEADSSNDKLAIALHYEIGTEEEQDPIIQKIIDAEKQTQNTTTININLQYYIKRGNVYNFWMYLGSPTIPSCIDGTINWIIIDKRFKISPSQYEYFHNKFYVQFQTDGNYRELKTTTSPVGYYTFFGN